MLKNKITNSVFNNIFYSLYSVAAREESKLSHFRGKWSVRTERRFCKIRAEKDRHQSDSFEIWKYFVIIKLYFINSKQVIF